MVMSRIINMAKKIFKRIIHSKDYVVYSGIELPAPHLRWCGTEFRDHGYYLQSAKNEAQRLVDHCQLGDKSAVLDVGCGPGRLPIGIIQVVGEIDYTGVDVDRDSIRWCRKHIAEKHPSFKFQHLNVENERYNPHGTPLDENFRFDFPDNRFDVIYLYSVFSHTHEKDLRIYLADFRRILKKDGKVFFTTFVEENVPDVSINPENYIFKKYSGALHVVRYDKKYLFALLKELGFSVSRFTHKTETDGQSAVFLTLS